MPVATEHERANLPPVEVKEKSVPDRIPRLQKQAASIGMKAMWVSRGTRPDISVAVSRISRAYTKWTRSDDAALHRLMRYLKETSSMGLWMRAGPNDLDTAVVSCWVDASFAGEKSTARSTSGYIVALEGQNSWIATNWAVRQQTSTARHTADAEVTAMDTAVHADGIPLQGLTETVLNREVRLVVHEDNSAAAQAVRRGYSRKMSYLPKTQRVSISALHETLIGNRGNPEQGEVYNVLVDEPTKAQRGDLFTKGLPHGRHWYLCEKIGLGFPDGTTSVKDTTGEEEEAP